MGFLPQFGSDAMREMNEVKRQGTKSNTARASGNWAEWTKTPRHIWGAVLLPVIVVLQLRMLPSVFSGYGGENMDDPLVQAQYMVDPLTTSEHLSRIVVGLLGMAIWWVLLYFLLRKTEPKNVSMKI